MHLDIRTLLIGFTVLELAIFLAMFFFWRTQRTYAGFGHWAICNLLFLAGCLLLGLNRMIPLALSEVLGNTAFVVGAQLRLRGLRLFLGRPAGERLDWVYAPATMAGLAWFSLVDDNWPWRTMVISLLLAVVALKGAWLLWRAENSAPSSRTLYRAAALAVLLYVIALMARAFSVLPPREGAWLFMPSPLQYIYFLMGVVVEVFWNLGFAMMNSSRLAAELLEAKDNLAHLASVDSLTGVFNRRQLLDLGHQEAARSLRYGRPLAVLALDLDNFKEVNDSLGHQAGDLILAQVVRLCADQLRASDILGRMGGDEFVAILPETGLDGARQMAERLCHCVRRGFTDRCGPEQAITLSLGISLLQEGDKGLDEVLSRADQALYQAKHQGRNQVACL